VHQAHRPDPLPENNRVLYLGQEPRRRVRKPAHERKPLIVEQAEPNFVSCAIYVVGLLFILFVAVFVLLKANGVT